MLINYLTNLRKEGKNPSFLLKHSTVKFKTQRDVNYIGLRIVLTISKKGDKTLGERNGGDLCLFGMQSCCKVPKYQFSIVKLRKSHNNQGRAAVSILRICFFKRHIRKYILRLYVFILFHETDPTVLPTV